MKFGKHIQGQQVPGWSAYYLDYKFLKKIISSLAANRPASEAASLALGVRPADILTPSTPRPTVSSPSSSSSPSHQSQSPRTQATASNVDYNNHGRPPIYLASAQEDDQTPDFRSHKAAFFFKLERELEKINAFYLQKEAELQLRLETLLIKRRAAAMRGLPDPNGDATTNHVEWAAVGEGFRLLERDLGKLQQFIEVNATGFRKILKKFDKRSKLTTKELYLARQVDVQPVFNRQLISELSDTVAICLLDLTDLSSGLKFEGPAANDIFAQRMLMERSSPTGPFYDLENSLRKAALSSDASAVKECVLSSDLLAQQNGGKTNITRILWSVIIEAPPDMADLILQSLSIPLDFQFIDDINGRTCLHEAAIAGTLRLVDMCIDNGTQVDKVDLYGRTALHYACINGHWKVCQRLLQIGVPPNTLDRDNYSPLVYATLRGCVDCVRVLLDEGQVPAEPTSRQGDLIPLSLASQLGHVDVVLFLLQHGVHCLPNSNGEYPMHLAAREGHDAVCKLLLHRDGWDTPDKYHEWTPLFHAARFGNDQCVNTLLEAGSRGMITDELGHSAAHYAAWYGHQKCWIALLGASRSTPTSFVAASHIPVDSPASDLGRPTDSEIDMIPSLSLPPPIMPHRVYGHNYLDKSNLVQVSIGHAQNRTKGLPGVRLHHRLINAVFRDEYLLASTPLKLVMTTSQSVTSAPYSISLPEGDDVGAFVFQIPSLSLLSLEFSIYPNFGTKTIGRAVALPSLFANIENNQPFTLPILDTRLHIVGEVDFEINIVTSFDGVTLEVGGDVETYWKSMAMPINAVKPSGLSRWPQRGLIGSTQTSPASHSITSTADKALTISSLRGNYLCITIQVTRDLQPVVFRDWLLPGTQFDLAVSDVTLEQFMNVSEKLGRQNAELMTGSAPADLPTLVANSMIPLASVLKGLPLSVNVALELAYPSRTVRELLSIGHHLDLNAFVDSVLRTVSASQSSLSSPHEASSDRRGIVFTSYNPDVCSALNWKQPNYPVFFASRCGKDEESSNDYRVTSVGAAVEFARANNLLGVFVDGDLLIQVPSLINGIRNAGLVVGIHGSSEEYAELNAVSASEDSQVDAFFGNGIVKYVDRSSRELA